MSETVAKTTKPRSYKKRFIWKPKMESLLIDLWHERAVDLKKSKRNSHVYNEMSQECRKNGMQISANVIKTKVDNFTKTYRKEKKIAGTTGSPSKWIYYKDIHKIMGTSSINNVSPIKEESVEIDESSLDSINSSQISEVSESNISLTIPVHYIDDNNFNALGPILSNQRDNSVSSEPDIGSQKKKRKCQDPVLKVLEQIQESIQQFFASHLAKEEERNQIFKNAEEKKLEILRQKNKILNKAREEQKTALDRRNNILEQLLQKL